MQPDNLFLNISLIDLYLISPGICLFVCSILILMIKLALKNEDLSKRIVFVLSFASILTTWLLSLYIFKSLGIEKIFAFGGTMVFDAFTYWTGSAVFLAASVSLFLFKENKDIKNFQFSEFIFLFLNSIFGVLVVLWSNNLLVLFVGAELVALPLYTMILLSRQSGYTKESAVKYYILGSVASAFFLLGLVLIYGSSAGQFGNDILLNVEGLLEVSSELVKMDHLFLMGSTFMLLAGLLKLGVFPMHNWVPDVYQGSNTAMTYYMITVAKISAVVVILKLMSAGFLVDAGFFQMAIQWIVVLSMVFGALFALFQESIKRIFAYSGIAHSGYMLMSILGYGFDGKGSVDSLVFYFFPYIFFSGLIFYVLQVLEAEKGADLVVLDLTGLHQYRPQEAFSLLLGVLGVAGMPPLVGFITKFYILKTTVQTGFYWVSFWALMATAISMVYYLRIIGKVYFYNYSSEAHALWVNPLQKKSFSRKGIVTLLVLLLLSLFSVYYFPVNS